MIRAVIIDDEESTVNVLKLLLRKYVSEVADVHTAVGSSAGLQSIQRYEPNLIFLDIEMPLMNGFELLEEFPNHSFEVIFVTAYDHYAIKAIKYSALDYLLKPVDVEELKNAVQRFIVKRQTGQSLKPLYENLLHNLKSEKVSEYRLAVATTEGTFFYSPDDIIRCEADGNYTKFFLKNQKPIITSKTLKEYDEMLAEQNFIRVHRAHLVNKRYIASFSGDHELKMKDNSTVEVSRRRWDAVKQELMTATN
jgi:two-component system LytT family response regulator